MGWLFGKKKETPRVPFPQGAEEGALRLGKGAGSRVIEPEKLREAAGIGREEEEGAIPFQRREIASASLQQRPLPMQQAMPGAFARAVAQEYQPLFIKVESYQRILGELDGMKEQLGKLGETSRKLESSEYNEEKNFASLQRGTKAIHDHMLQVDSTIFKTRSE